MTSFRTLIGDFERTGGLSAAERAYLRLHARRYEELLTGMRARVGGSGEGRRFLDVAPSLQTALIRAAFPGALVDTLGFANPHARPRDGELHLDCDLNRVSDPAARPSFSSDHDVVVMGELIEHLTVSPVAVVETVTGSLRRGGRLIVQTPNLLALHKRVRTVIGRNPLGRAGAVANPSHNPGHFREYTAGELTEIGAAAGLAVEELTIRNYFTRASAPGRAYDAVTALLPEGTRQGITVYFRS